MTLLQKKENSSCPMNSTVILKNKSWNASPPFQQPNYQLAAKIGRESLEKCAASCFTMPVQA